MFSKVSSTHPQADRTPKTLLWHESLAYPSISPISAAAQATLQKHPKNLDNATTGMFGSCFSVPLFQYPCYDFFQLRINQKSLERKNTQKGTLI